MSGGGRAGGARDGERDPEGRAEAVRHLLGDEQGRGGGVDGGEEFGKTDHDSTMARLGCLVEGSNAGGPALALHDQVAVPR